jgi:hypothetical protein
LKKEKDHQRIWSLFEGAFRPYTPSNNIAEKFYLKTEEFQRSNPGYKNPFEEAAPVIYQMIEDMAGADLSKPLDLNYLIMVLMKKRQLQQKVVHLIHIKVNFQNNQCQINK